MHRACLVTITLTILFLWVQEKMAAVAPVSRKPSSGFHHDFETLKGFFAQSEDGTDDSKFDFVSHAKPKLYQKKNFLIN